jgi:23S rRNA (guanosine2251-2'-O)-methyltransferase
VAGVDRIEGRNPIREALRAGRRLRRIMVASGADARGGLAELLDAARAAGVPVERVPREAIDKVAVTRAHQGVVAEADPFRYRSYRDAIDEALGRGEKPLLLALDGITDPGNLGSLLRSAEAAGCHAVLVPQRRAAPVTPVVEKASAGALEHLVIDQVPNLERSLDDCRKRGLWRVGLSGESEASLWGCDLLAEPVVLVVGAEGHGLSRLIRERMDVLVQIPMAGRVGSLSAPVAGAIALFESRRMRDRTEPLDGR